MRPHSAAPSFLVARRVLAGTTIAVLATAAIGLVDYQTGPNFSFSLFYIAPILAAGWYLGAWPATIVAVWATAVWFVADIALFGRADSAVWQWNTLSRLVTSLIIARLTARVRRDRERLDALVSHERGERIATVDQLRHRDRLATVGRIASGVAHEVGTPLNVISGRARLVTDSDTTLDEARGHARVIVDQAARVTAIIRQLLDFARRRGPEFDDVDVRDVARATASLLAPIAEKHGVTLRVEAEFVPVVAPVDYTQMQQALANLVLNGIQAMPGGGPLTVRVASVHREPPREVGEGAAAFACLEVVDSGTGIEAENLPRIFEPFFTTQKVGEGTGLGLSIAYGIARDHGGWIDVETNPPHGSRFSIFLPKDAAPEAGPEAP